MLSASLSSFAWVFALFLLQNTLVYLFPEKSPSLVLTGVLYYALFDGTSAGLAAGCWGGLLLDLFSQGRPGFFTAAFAACGLACGVLSSKIFEDSWLSEVILPFLSLFCVLLAQQLVLRTQTGEAWTPGILLDAFLPWPLLATAVCSPWFFGRLRRYSPRQRRRWTPRA